MTSAALRRRRRDRLIAAVIAVAAIAAGVVVYLTSDARATTLVVAPDAVPPAAMTTAPTALQQVWQAETDPRFPAIGSPYGTVVTADRHTVSGRDPITGDVRWSYGRSNLDLCVVGSGDTDATGITLGGGVRGILTGYVKSGRCSELTLLNPITGDRRYQRTGFTGADSTPVFGGPYGGLVSFDLVELWRYDLVRTIQYGNQPEPTKPNTRHTGCEFADVALNTNQFGSIEHCAADGPTAALVLNYDDPGSTADGRSKSWDALKYDPRTTVDLHSDHARLLSVAAEEALVVVASPEPAAVRYDSTGAELSRTPLPVTAEEIAAADADRVTPVLIHGNARYVLVGSTLIAVSDELAVNWSMPGVLGVPAAAGDDLLVPVDGGLAVVSTADGSTSRTIAVDRSGYTGRVSVGAVGNTVVETRGGTVVALRDPAGPATDDPSTETRARPTGRLPTTWPTDPNTDPFAESFAPEPFAPGSFNPDSPDAETPSAATTVTGTDAR